MSFIHERYEEISVQGCTQDCPHQGGMVLKIILFEEREKLRSHAVKHFANPKESEISWKKIGSTDDQLAVQCVNELYLLGCPFFGSVLGLEYPPCRGCRFFHDKCTEITRDLEDEYLKVINDVIKDGGNTPRYACCFSNRDNAHIFWTMPKQRVTAKATLFKDDIYNLKTCYSAKSNVALQRIRDKEIGKIRKEASSGRVTWCNASNWGIRRYQL
ncbi:MAG: hypothetical protein DRI57_21965 [Deltaproteobacteria bacterium]|nr:MAG: hypothetical protein DRI57_21965 [Deltaproteobacteria bacterium]